ncbi:efflux RND transporter periplasmic adaptor subunit [Chromatiaceae bacterium AAb-1]|nr:efflux RND transporter periplasmic adaptor subunit [Chromatiaceae bacterium AAb-1]
MKCYQYLIAVSVIVLIVAASSVCSARTEGSQTSAPTAFSTQVQRVQLLKLPVWTEYSGRLEAIEQAEIRSRVSGPVTTIYFTEGTIVQQGEPLLLIDPAPYQARVRAARASVDAAEVQARRTEMEWQRGTVLFQSQLLSQQQMDELSFRRQEAAAGLSSARAELESRQLELQYTTVRAPISGRIGARRVTTGNLIETGPASPVLAVITALDPIYASFDVDDKFVSQLLPLAYGTSQQQLNIQLQHNDRLLDGSLQLVDNQLDSRTGTLRVRARFSNTDNQLLAGQFVRIRLAFATEQPQLAIDPRAVGTNQNQRFVMTLNHDNQAVYTTVELGAQVDGKQIIRHGLKQGDRVIVHADNRIRPGTLINPQYQPDTDHLTSTEG